MRDQRPCEEFRSWQELLADPLIALVMAADRVEPRNLGALLAKLKTRLGAGRAPAQPRAA